jgi:hypothetical protein
MMGPPDLLSDDELMSVADDPVLKTKLTPEERGRLSQLQSAGARSGGPVGRFVENAVQPLAQAPGMIATVGESLLPTQGGAQARQDLGRSLIDPSVDRLNRAAQAHREGRPLDAAGNVAAAFPVIGPAVAHGIDQMREGDVAGGAGTLTGIAAPFVAGPMTRALGRGTTAVLKGTTVGEGLADTLDASANRRLTDQMVPKVGPNKTRLGNRAAEVAPQLLRDPDLAAYSRTGLADKISARLDQAIEGLDTAANNRGVSQQVKTGPLVKQIDAAIADLTAQPVEASRVPRDQRPVPAATRNQQLDGLTGELTDGQAFKSEPYGTSVEPAPNTAQLTTLKRMREEVAALGPVATYEAVRRIRQAWDQVAKVKYSPAVSPDYLAKQGEATGAATGTRALRQGLAETDPGSATAYAQYTLYKTADDVVQAAEEANRVRPNRGRGMVARATGAMIGAKEGGIAGAGIGAIVAGIADRAAEMAPTFQIAIARRMAAVADALRAGDTAGAQAIVDRTIAKFPAVKTGLKFSGKLTPAASVGSGLPLAAGDDHQRP